MDAAVAAAVPSVVDAAEDSVRAAFAGRFQRRAQISWRDSDFAPNAGLGAGARHSIAANSIIHLIAL
jgi:hypothetical protein